MLEAIGAIAIALWAYMIYQTLLGIAEGVRYIAEQLEDSEEEDDPEDDTPEDATPPEEVRSLKVVGER